MKKPPKADYSVGDQKPPEHTRFQAGVSGNPKGRPKGSKNMNSMLSDVLNAKVQVTDAAGRRRTMTKLEAVATQLVNRAIKGDHRAAKEVLALAPHVEHTRVIQRVNADDARKELLTKMLQMKDRMERKPE